MSTLAAWVDRDPGAVRDPAARALLAALRGETAASWGGAEAAAVEALAVRNRVEGELRRRIASAGEGAPAWARGLRPALEARGLAHDEAFRRVSAAIREVGAAFAARGIEAVALKGFHLASAVYPGPADRPFTDVDLLVAPADRPHAEETLLALGYAHGKAQTGAGAIEASFDREIAPGRPLEIDLHWALAGALSLVREMRPDAAGLRARSTPAFPGIRFPAFEDALAFAAVNLAVHGFRPLGNILDFRELVARADPEALAARAAESRTTAALSAGLALAAAMFGAEIPSALDRPLALPRWQRALFRRLLQPATLVHPELAEGATARYALKILSQDGAKGVARTIAGLPEAAIRRLARR